MTTREKLPADEKKENVSSSQGDDSKSVTPKDLDSSCAASKDVTERKVGSANEDEKQEEQLDDAVEMTFPASDPIAIPDPHKEDHRHGK